jgi:hypothetical protein
MKSLYTILILVGLLFVSNTTGQPLQKISRAGNQNTFTRIDEPLVYQYRNQLGKIATAEFDVDYDANVPPEAIIAFEKAIDIWKYLIVVSKPVKIKVSFVNEPGSGMLGGTGIPAWRNNYSNFQYNDTQYPISLAKHLDHSIVYTDYDIEMEFNGAQNFNSVHSNIS